ncbi:MAG: PASTA domain-containing protein [Pseudothermotoga sp.]
MKKILSFAFYLILGIIVGAALFFVYFLIRPEVVEVPDLKGLKVDEAIEVLKRNGLKVDKTFGTGVVDHTFPNAGQKVRKNRAIILFLGEPELLVIPDLIGAPKESAIQILSRIGFQVRVVEMPFKGTDGRVMSVYPPAGRSVKRGEEISILVDSGEPEGVDQF